MTDIDDVAVGPWAPELHRGYAADNKAWIVSRENSKEWMGRERLLTANYNVRRFGSEKAAKKMADALNAAAPEMPS